MASEKKTFRVVCAECGKRFFVHFKVEDETAEGVGEETVRCMHCNNQVKIPLPTIYMKPDELIRSLKVDE